MILGYLNVYFVADMFPIFSFAGNPGLTVPEAGPPPSLPCKLACLNLDC